MTEVSDFMEEAAGDNTFPPDLPDGKYVVLLRNFEPQVANNEKQTPYVAAQIAATSMLEGDEDTFAKCEKTFYHNFWMTDKSKKFVLRDYFNRALGMDIVDGDQRSWKSLFEAAVGQEFVAEVRAESYGDREPKPRITRFYKI